MSKHNAHNVARELKSKLKTALAVLKLTRPRKYSNAEIQAAPTPVAAVVDVTQELTNIGMPHSPSIGTIQTRTEAVEQNPNGEHDRTDCIAKLPFQGASDVSKGFAGDKTNVVHADASTSSTVAASVVKGKAVENSITISLEPDLDRQLRAAVLGHRNLNALEHDADLRLGSLEKQADSIAQQIEGLEKVILDLRAGPESSEHFARIDGLYDAISKLREAEDDCHQRSQRLTRHMSGLYQDFRDEQWMLFETLDSRLVEKAMIPPAARLTPSCGGPHASSSPPLNQSLKHASPLRHSTTSINEHTRDVFDQAAAEAGTRAALLNDFIAKRTYLATREQLFDTRLDLFDALETSRMQDLEVGEEVETSIEFDHYLYEETRQLTRKLIDAEADYCAAKDAATAAGIHLKYSDIESGFVDDVDDGYRVSMERELAEHCDRERIQDWLMDIEEKACPTRYLSVRDCALLGDLNHVDDWIGDEIGLSDSASQVAEGPSRRRIDRWRLQVARL